ncbi:Transmembrane BAX inhibitor motif-containing protein 4 [Physocladia obscura]|uniref:Transmembrane BAX inhibitor motif-containing protein 4 n=1 Tax=Physocladia obscura TaxID=109957 RepID=A0AAD5T7T6_9FUNG|nr:Transmembrane BAX inhibitor motif-containing protein 4 [Physocladia obscura]
MQTHHDSQAVPPPYIESSDIEAAPLLGANEKPLLSECDLEVRLNFVRKVYSILAAQFALTTVVSAIFMYNVDIKHAVQSKYLLTAFTLAESYSIGVICTLYDSETVLQAVILTFIVFISLTLFTLQSKIKFDGLAPFLFTSLTILVFASFLQIFFPFNKFVDLAIAIVTAVVFSGYIVFDTYMIFTRMTADEYVLAAVELYLDVINLFLAILRILGNSSRDD